ncbi:hypothetical protein ZOSMA_15G01730 [Zostera marina]|uniref:Uncharacterized protein n=1 Tax=Zostera marina TaxID=29655 RepID=A0A0K9PUW9_ZOSMR|nr:hypothetical protein ZOSMA_15G01730 [Zostera marina]
MGQNDTAHPKEASTSRVRSIEEEDPAPVAPPEFDPSRMFGIIKRKALIKDVASAYHAAIFKCCQQLLELQKEQDYTNEKRDRPTKHLKKSR